MIRTLRRAVLLLLLVAAAYVGFRWGPIVFPRLESMLGIDQEGPEYVGADGPSPELADATLDRFERFRRGEGGDSLVLDGNEITSVIRYALPGILPPGVSDPRVELSEGRVTIEARVATASFPELPDIGGVVGLLPDTIPVDVQGTLEPLDQATLRLVVDRVRASRVPVPDRMVADVLAGLGGDRASGVPRTLRVPLPDGIERVEVVGDRMILIAEADEDG